MIDIPKEKFKIENFLKKEWCVYFLYKKDELVYIGKTGELQNRLKNHSNCKDFDAINFIKVDSEGDALLIEEKLIKKHKPKLNIASTGYKNLILEKDCSISVDEIKELMIEKNIFFYEIDEFLKVKKEQYAEIKKIIKTHPKELEKLRKDKTNKKTEREEYYKNSRKINEKIITELKNNLNLIAKNQKKQKNNS